MASEAGACQTRNMGSYEDDDEEEKEVAPLDEVGVVVCVCACVGRRSIHRSIDWWVEKNGCRMCVCVDGRSGDQTQPQDPTR